MAKDDENKKAAGAPVENPDAAALAAENEKLKAELAATKAKVADGTFTAEDSQLVELKVAAGLPREQAIEVVKQQKAHDRALASNKK